MFYHHAHGAPPLSSFLAAYLLHFSSFLSRFSFLFISTPFLTSFLCSPVLLTSVYLPFTHKTSSPSFMLTYLKLALQARASITQSWLGRTQGALGRHPFWDRGRLPSHVFFLASLTPAVIADSSLFLLFCFRLKCAADGTQVVKMFIRSSFRRVPAHRRQ